MQGYNKSYKTQVERYLSSKISSYKNTIKMLNKVFTEDSQKTTEEKMNNYFELTGRDLNDAYILVEKLSKLTPESEHPTIATSLIEHNTGFALLDKLDHYENVDKNDIIQLLIENNKFDLLLQHFNKLDLDTASLAQILIENDSPETIIFNVDKFSDLDADIVQKLLNIDFKNEFTRETLFQEITNFKNIDIHAIITTVIKNGHTASFLERAYIDELESVKTDTKLLELLITEIKSNNLGKGWLDELQYTFDTSNAEVAELFASARKELS